MTIVYLLRYYPTLTETFVYNEIQSLVEQGAQIQIVSMGSREDGQLADMLPNVPVTHVPRAYWLRFKSSSSPGIAFLKAHQRPKDIARYRWFRAQMKRLRPSLLHIHFAGEAAEWGHALTLDLGIPSCITIHAVDMFRPRPSLQHLIKHTPIRCISRFALEALTKENPMAKLSCIPCATHIPERCPPIPEASLKALFIGRDIPKKGLSTLLEAWKNIPAPHSLTIVSQSIKEMPDGVAHLGFLPPSQIPFQIQNHNLLVLPCQKAEDGDMDGIPLVCMEALAHRRPVLSTALSGIPELITDDVGWLMKEATVSELTQVLFEIISHLPTLKARGLNGPSRLIEGGFTYQQQSQDLMIWFHNVTVSCQIDP